MSINTEFGNAKFISQNEPYSGQQNRLFFEAFIEPKNDVNEKTGKTGIRLYTNKIAIFVLKLLVHCQI